MRNELQLKPRTKQELATKERIAFMIKYTSGVLCCAIEGDRAQDLDLPQMVAKNEVRHQNEALLSRPSRSLITDLNRFNLPNLRELEWTRLGCDDAKTLESQLEQT